MKEDPEELTGTAVSELVRPGTAGEHQAVVLHLDDGGHVILQRRGGNPFDDPQTRSLAGHRVRVTGYRLTDVFRFLEVEVLDA